MASTAYDAHHGHQAHGGHDDHPALQHHFESLEQQKESSTLGTWMFLVTEIMFFGGLFTAYVVYRGMFHGVFAIASSHLNWKLGALNTAVLIASSLTMAMAIWAAQMNRRKLIVWFLLLTIALGSVFLVVKTFEYKEKFDHHLVPGPHFAPDDPRLQAVSNQAQVFYSIYFIMTGLHALHMVIGIGLLIWLLFPSWKGKFDSRYYNPLECTGLYWHFVDLVWIFLFPLLYLLGANQTH
ncbi:MAG TPA: cytochrome c oxidase subunit 3 family protein [Thermoanaerobaculia bacterium]|nr:cytochrome c oxidase subunit 3 family protein [Thermoanaerobaculia bacterium]